jgi:hypothetical protein
MAIPCPRCNRQYDITLFEFGRKVVCECGEVISAEGVFPPDLAGRRDPIRTQEKEEAKRVARQHMEVLRRAADRLCTLILLSDYPEIDLEIEKAKVRELAEELFPNRMELYEMIYESRFRRLWEQFRSEPDEPRYETLWRPEK